MSRYILILALIFISSLSHSQSGDCGGSVSIDWVKAIGGNSEDQINDIVTDSEGNVYITGYFNETLTSGSIQINSAGAKDFFLAKSDNSGNIIWIKKCGGIDDDYGKAIALDSDKNIYVTGIFGRDADFDGNIIPRKGGNTTANDDIFTIKFSNNGNYIWGRSFGNSQYDISSEIAVDDYNNVIITGAYKNAVSFAGKNIFAKGGYDFFVAQYTTDGVELWMSEHGATGDDYARDIVCYNNNEIYVIGEFSGTLQFKDGSSMTTQIQGTKDIFVIKLSSFGYKEWSATIGKTNEDIVGGLALDSSGENVYACFYANTPTDKAHIAILPKDYSGTENFIFFGGIGDVFPKDIAIDNFDNIYVTGQYSGTTDFGDGINVTTTNDNFFLIKYDNAGNFVYKHLPENSSGINCGNSIYLDNEESIIIGGFFNNNIVLNGNTYQSNGSSDLMLIKYKKYFNFGDISISSINCDSNNMCIEVEVLGGVIPLTYNWSTSDNTSKICGLTPGTYNITVTDNTGCEIDQSITVAPIVLPTINLPISAFVCPNEYITLDAGSNFSKFIWSTGDTTQSINATETGTYSVTATDDKSCTATASSSVTRFPDVTLFPNDTIYKCIEKYEEFLITGYFSYLWSDNSTYPDFSTNEAGKYWLRVFDGNCYHYDTVEIINYPITNIYLGNNTYICEGDSIQLSPGAGFYDYLWNDGSSNDNVWIKSDGIVSVTITDGNGCNSSDSIKIDVIELPTINLGNDTTYCTNSSVTLTVDNNNSGNKYLWSTGSKTKSISVSQSGEYWVEVTNKEGCIKYDTITVTIFPLPKIHLGEDITYCQGESRLIEIYDSFESYLWSDGSTDSYTTISGTQTLSVTVTDSNGCTDSDDISATEHIVTNPFIGNDTTICEGIVYTLSPNYSYKTYHWSTGESTSSITISQTGIYSLTVTDNTDCSNSSSVSVYYSPNPNITNINTNLGNLVVSATGGTPPYSYSIDGETWQESSTLDNIPPDFYTVFVKDYNNCTGQRKVFLEETIKIPDFFTPNGDGYNDYWTIEGLYNYPNTNIYIFDRYGKLLYEFNAGGKWDGTYNGNPLPSDTYWYVVDFGKEKPIRKGSVTIKR